MTITPPDTGAEKLVAGASAATARAPWQQPWWFSSEGQRPVLYYLIIVHVLAVTGLILFPVPGATVFLIALGLSSLGGLGTTVCYHRALAHRSLRLNPIVEQLLIGFAVFNGSGSPRQWTANHRLHHAKTDTPEDVSSPAHGGFWWAHMRWLYQMPQASPSRWAPDLERPRYAIWCQLQAWLVPAALTCGLLLGWRGFFWIGAIRLVYALHMQSFVNSLTHLGDGRDGDRSVNVWWLGPLQGSAWGENWHRNHHQEPASARLGRRWYQVDIGWYVIRLLEALGLAHSVRHGKADAVTGTMAPGGR